MAADVRYIRAQVSIFYHNADVLAFDQNEMADVVAGFYLPPVRFDGTGDGLVRVMVSENGNSQIIVSASSIALHVTFSPQWQKQSHLGHQYVKERVRLLFGIVASLPERSLIYAGAAVETEVVSSLEDMDDWAIAKAIESIYGGRFGTNLSDLQVRASEVVDGDYYRNVTVQNFRKFVAGSQTPPQIRLKNSTASERGVAVAVDFNSRYGYNEGRNTAVTLENVIGIIDAAYAASANMSQRVSERMS